MSDMLKGLLKEGASAAQVELTDEQLDKFEKYYDEKVDEFEKGLKNNEK